VSDMLLVLLTLFVVMAVVTVIGHGIWVFLGMLFRAVGGGERRKTHGPLVPNARADYRQCVFCDRQTGVRLDRCQWCGRDLRSNAANELADLQAVRRQLLRMQVAGELDDKQVLDLLSRVEKNRQRVLNPRGAASAAKPISPETAPAKPMPPKRPPVRQPSEDEPLDAIILEEKVAEQPPTKPQEPKIPPEKPVVPAPLALEQLPQPAQPPKPRAPRRSFSEMLSAFMEERNIRWGELIGGLLIVGCSTALVMTLWDVLSSIPYFPFLVFVTISAAIFGVGLYAHHRWRLASTSRGLLVIATLLVPLNCLTMTGSPACGSTPSQNSAYGFPATRSLSTGAFLIQTPPSS
jgi:hypothetical protein